MAGSLHAVMLTHVGHRCYPGGKPPSGAAETGCKLQLYREKLPALTPVKYQIPGAPV